MLLNEVPYENHGLKINNHIFQWCAFSLNENVNCVIEMENLKELNQRE